MQHTCIVATVVLLSWLYSVCQVFCPVLQLNRDENEPGPEFIYPKNQWSSDKTGEEDPLARKANVDFAEKKHYVTSAIFHAWTYFMLTSHT